MGKSQNSDTNSLNATVKYQVRVCAKWAQIKDPGMGRDLKVGDSYEQD